MSKPWIVLLWMLLLGGCFTPESTARAYLEEQSCHEIELTRVGLADFHYTAMCRDRFCRGSMALEGPRTSNQHVCFDAPDVGHDAAPHGQVDIGLGNTTGTCPPETIERELQTRVEAMRTCYDHALRVDPNTQGWIRSRWHIDRDGQAKVLAPDAAGGPIRCIHDVLEGASWPRPEAGTCEVQWTTILHTGEPGEYGGTTKPPLSETCDLPPEFQLQAGERSLTPEQFVDEFEGSWTLVSSEIWLQGMIHAESTSFEGAHASFDGRTFLNCLAVKSASVTSYVALPARFSASSDRFSSVRRFDVGTKDGELELELREAPNYSRFSRTASEMGVTLVERNGTVEVLRHYKEQDLAIRAVYVRTGPG